MPEPKPSRSDVSRETSRRRRDRVWIATPRRIVSSRCAPKGVDPELDDRVRDLAKVRQILITLVSTRSSSRRRVRSFCARTPPTTSDRLRSTGHAASASTSRPRAHLRSVLASRSEQDTAYRREWPRTQRRAPTGPAARRRDLGRQHAIRRQHVPRAASEIAPRLAYAHPRPWTFNTRIQRRDASRSRAHCRRVNDPCSGVAGAR